MLNKVFEIDLDIKDPKFKLVSPIEVVSGDTDTNIFNIQLFENFAPVNASGNSVVIIFGKPDNTTVFQNLTVVDATKGQYTCTLSSQTIAVPGRIKAEVALYEGIKRLTSTRFEFTVRKAILDENTVESSNEFSALTQALSEVTDLKNLAGEGRTTETVKGNADDLATHKAETTPHSETASRTITVGTGKDFATIQEAVDSIKKRVDAIITINVDAGTYAESVSINGFLGSGAIIINGGNSLETAVNYSVDAFIVSDSTIVIGIVGFIGTSATYPFWNSSSMNTAFKYCTSTSVGTIGFYFNRANGGCDNCLASNKTDAALYVAAGATVFSSSWTAGSNNAIGLFCRSASTIGKYGTQPQGTTAEISDQGGVIR